jgi:hypothetical protein
MALSASYDGVGTGADAPPLALIEGAGSDDDASELLGLPLT